MEKIKISANVVKETARNISDDGKQEFESALATLQIFFDEPQGSTDARCRLFRSVSKTS